MARILGVDPGTHYVGIGIIDFNGNRYCRVHSEILTVPRLEVAERLLWIHRAIRAQIEAHKPEVVALESFFYGKDHRAMVRVGESRACVMLAASEYGLSVIEYGPTRVKQAVTGNGRASKEQVQHMVKMLLAMKEAAGGDDSDALAIAICHAHSSGKKMLIPGSRSCKHA